MAERIAIIDYGSGNLRSVARAFERAAREAGLAAVVDVTADPETIAASDRIVLPGVGAFRACREGLGRDPAVIAAMEHAALIEARPFLGICVGMQLLAERGLEFGATPGLAWIPGEVRALDPGPARRVPHTGWNEAQPVDRHPVIGDTAEDFYFVHSFHFVPENQSHALALCDYGGNFVAAVGRDNILGVQFHPEKSQAAGLALISRFLSWRP